MILLDFCNLVMASIEFIFELLLCLFSMSLSLFALYSDLAFHLLNHLVTHVHAFARPKTQIFTHYSVFFKLYIGNRGIKSY